MNPSVGWDLVGERDQGKRERDEREAVKILKGVMVLVFTFIRNDEESCFKMKTRSFFVQKIPTTVFPPSTSPISSVSPLSPDSLPFCFLFRKEEQASKR